MYWISTLSKLSSSWLLIGVNYASSSNADWFRPSLSEFQVLLSAVRLLVQEFYRNYPIEPAKSWFHERRQSAAHGQSLMKHFCGLHNWAFFGIGRSWTKICISTFHPRFDTTRWRFFNGPSYLLLIAVNTHDWHLLPSCSESLRGRLCSCGSAALARSMDD